jgi:starch-binding outer membrane protein, SusD/RagB family
MKQLLHLIFAAALIFTAGGCKKFLYQEPYNNISINDIFKDFEGARTALAGCYDDLKSGDYYLRTFSLYPEVTSGNIKYSKLSNQALLLSYNFNNDAAANDMKAYFIMAYSIIYNTNTIIANIDNVLDASSLQKSRLLADAYTIRALVHFDLARVFAQGYSFTPDASHPGITVRNTVVSALTPVDNVQTCKQVFAQVTSDLDSAMLLYPNSAKVFSLGDDKTYCSFDAAKALQSRVALYKNDWSKVIALSTDLISSNKYQLISNSGYVASWKQRNISSESIFELAFGDRTGGSLGDYYNASNSLFGQMSTSNDLLSLYSVGDVRAQPSMYVKATVNSTDYYFTRKYQGMNDSANNIKIIRLSEIYLNRAEAYAESDNLVAALADLNVIRKRANPASINFESTDKATVINEILDERRRELCFEGHGFFDLSRKKKNLVRTDCTSTQCSFVYPNSRYACIFPLTN